MMLMLDISIMPSGSRCGLVVGIHGESTIGAELVVPHLPDEAPMRVP